MQRSSLWNALDAGPQLTPSITQEVAPDGRLRAYPPIQPDGLAVLLVPAPIKRFYIWDLSARGYTRSTAP